MAGDISTNLNGINFKARQALDNQRAAKKWDEKLPHLDSALRAIQSSGRTSAKQVENAAGDPGAVRMKLVAQMADKALEAVESTDVDCLKGTMMEQALDDISVLSSTPDAALDRVAVAREIAQRTVSRQQSYSKFEGMQTHVLSQGLADLGIITDPGGVKSDKTTLDLLGKLHALTAPAIPKDSDKAKRLQVLSSGMEVLNRVLSTQPTVNSAPAQKPAAPAPVASKPATANVPGPIQMQAPSSAEGPLAKLAKSRSSINGPELQEALAKLDALVGMDKAKEEVHDLINYMLVQKLREQQKLPKVDMSHHFVFTGSPGTGKTTVARLLGNIFHALGFLSKGHTVEVDRSSVVGKTVGSTAPNVKEKIKEAKGGVLFVDEAYSLTEDGRGGFGYEAVDALLKGIEDQREDMVVIVAGYQDRMFDFISANPGLRSRFNKFIEFEDFKPEELHTILGGMVRDGGTDKPVRPDNDPAYKMSPEASVRAKHVLDAIYRGRDDSYGNAREVRNLFEAVITNHGNRVAQIDNPTRDQLLTLEPADFDGIRREADTPQPLEEVLKELDSLVGMDDIKSKVHELVSHSKIQQRRKELGLPVTSLTHHFVFTGNPGTGKTTVANIIGKVYRSLGLLSSGHTVAAERKDLVAGHVGQTANMTDRVCKKALGGVLFIDEAYSLTSTGANYDFGAEAIEALVTNMENHRENMVVVVAGYPEKMGRFIDSNPGLASRFVNYVHFDDYTPDNLTEIFVGMAKKANYEVSEEAKAQARKDFASLYEGRDKNFGNGRVARNYFEKAVKRQEKRLDKIEQASAEQLTTLEAADMPDPKSVMQSFKGEGRTAEEIDPKIEEELIKLLRERNLSTGGASNPTPQPPVVPPAANGSQPPVVPPAGQTPVTA